MTRGYGEMTSNAVFSVNFDLGKITPQRVKIAQEQYRRRFGTAATLLVVGAHREEEARAAAAGELAVDVRRGGLLGGEFWLGQVEA